MCLGMGQQQEQQYRPPVVAPDRSGMFAAQNGAPQRQVPPIAPDVGRVMSPQEGAMGEVDLKEVVRQAIMRGHRN